MMSTILYFGNLKTLTQTLDNKMPTPSGMETKNEMRIMQTTIKKMEPIWKRNQKKIKNKIKYDKVVDI